MQRKLAAFGDDSSNYLWKLYAAREIMRLSREDPEELARLQALQTAKNSAEEVLHPLDETPRFAHPAALQAAWDDDAIRAFPNEPALTGLARDGRMGELAQRVGAPPGLYRGLRPEALALALYIGAQTREYAGGEGPLIVTSTVRDEDYQRQLVRPQPRGDAQLLAAHDRLGVRHRADLRVQAPGARVPVRARPAPGARRDRLGARARRDPRHRVGRRGGAAPAARAARPKRPRARRRSRR